MLLALIALAALPAAEPGFVWGNRPPVMARAGAPRPRSDEAAVVSVHAALDGGDLVVRFTFDRPVQRAIYGESGAPVSGRLRAVLYVDADDDRKTGLVAAANDPRQLVIVDIG